MKYRGRKLTASSLLMIVGVVCFMTTIVTAAGIIWAQFSTSSIPPAGEVTFNDVVMTDWTGAYVPDGAHDYHLTATVAYDYTAESPITYYLKVTATNTGAAVIASGDFTVTVSGITGASLTESSAGVWTSGAISVSSGHASDAMVITVTPQSGSADLNSVAFTVQALSSLA